MTSKVGVAEAKAKLSEMLERVREKGERYIIHRRGKPMAAVVPVDDLPLEHRLRADDWLYELLELGPEGGQFADTLDEVVGKRAAEMPRDVDLGDD